MVSFDDLSKHIGLSMRSRAELERLAMDVHPDQDGKHSARSCSFQPEGASFQLEATPSKPWGICSLDILDVEQNMKLRYVFTLQAWSEYTNRISVRRRAIIQAKLDKHIYFMTIASFPFLGAVTHSWKLGEQSYSKIQRSQYLTDDTITEIPRYYSMVRNIRLGRRRTPDIQLPIYRDVNTPWPFKDPTVNYKLNRYPEDDDINERTVKDNCIHMDATVFGCGCCGLQVTMQLRNIAEARKLHDQLIPLAPIMLALTAAAPVWKGFLADTDVRWNSFSAGVDDRSPEQRGEKVIYYSYS